MTDADDVAGGRYAEIVNVKLGNGQNRKGQVLEIAGRKAVVQVSKQTAAARSADKINARVAICFIFNSCC